MPAIPPSAPNVLDTVYSTMLAAKARLDDVIETLDEVTPQLLQRHQIFTQQVCNNAWRKGQLFLANLGNSAFYDQTDLLALPPTVNLDPSSQCWIDWFNYYNGSGIQLAPVLPPDLNFPLVVGERQSGAQWPFVPMENILETCPQQQKQWANRWWQWRRNRLYIPGAIGLIDLRIRYVLRMPDFLDIGNVQWFQQPVPLIDFKDALSLFICAEIAADREEMDEAGWIIKAEGAAKIWHNKDQRMKQRVNVRRQSRSGRMEAFGGGYGGYM